jgi:HprK-related kinase A
MNLGQLPAGELARRLAGPGIGIRTGPFNLRIRSDAAGVATGIRLLYEDYPVVESSAFCDYSIGVDRASGLRRWVRPQVRFTYDEELMYEPMPLGHALALTEWALNWCIGSNSHQYLVLHAAAVERGGYAAILPAPPGSGKSTLCAGLVSRGWRLLSDELALVSLQRLELHAVARPIGLKNQSIELIRHYAPEAVFSDETHATSKGTVAHMRAPRGDVLRVDEPALPGWVVFPRYAAGSAASLAPRDKADAMLQLSRNAFNSGVVGREGFHALADLVRDSDCYDFSYSDLDDAVAVFEDLAGRRRA